MLCVLALVMRTLDMDELRLCIGLLFTRHILEIVLLQQVYFSPEAELKTYVKVLLASIFLLNCFLIKIFVDLTELNSIWWAPVLLQDIILHFYIFMQLGVEYSFWDSKVAKWRREKIFSEKMASDPEQDEAQLKRQIEIQNVQQLQQNAPMSPSVNQEEGSGQNSGELGKKQAKELKLTANIYTVSYCAFMKKNKEKYRLKNND